MQLANQLADLLEALNTDFVVDARETDQASALLPQAAQDGCQHRVCHATTVDKEMRHLFCRVSLAGEVKLKLSRHLVREVILGQSEAPPVELGEGRQRNLRLPRTVVIEGHIGILCMLVRCQLHRLLLIIDLHIQLANL